MIEACSLWNVHSAEATFVAVGSVIALYESIMASFTSFAAHGGSDTPPTVAM